MAGSITTKAAATAAGPLAGGGEGDGLRILPSRLGRRQGYQWRGLSRAEYEENMGLNGHNSAERSSALISKGLFPTWIGTRMQMKERKNVFVRSVLQLNI
jgi:hypothetical protein